MRQKGNMIRRLLKGIGGTIVVLLAVGIFALVVILGQPQGREKAESIQEQPVLTASPAQRMTSKEEMEALTLPIPVLCCPNGAWELSEGSSYDLAFEKGFARVTALTYTREDGVSFQTKSIYPARATALLRDDPYILEGSGEPLAGLATAKMKYGDQIRLHAQSEEGLYCLIYQSKDEEILNEILQNLQLIRMDAEHVQ